MIYDRIERLAQYKGLNPNLDRLIDFALTADLSALPAGKTDIDGDNGWFSGITAKLAPESRVFERHTAYIDLQIPLEEGEVITLKPMEALAWPDSPDETLLTEGEPGLPLDMTPGFFAIFFPGDAHNCGNAKSGQTQARKLVGKAKV